MLSVEWRRISGSWSFPTHLISMNIVTQFDGEFQGNFASVHPTPLDTTMDHDMSDDALEEIMSAVSPIVPPRRVPDLAEDGAGNNEPASLSFLSPRRVAFGADPTDELSAAYMEQGTPVMVSDCNPTATMLSKSGPGRCAPCQNSLSCRTTFTPGPSPLMDLVKGGCEKICWEGEAADEFRGS